VSKRNAVRLASRMDTRSFQHLVGDWQAMYIHWCAAWRLVVSAECDIEHASFELCCLQILARDPY